uniref:Mediator of RNA polymerase II transcription subunit 27 n=1 Tax=Caenorhabditis japonica TaxID=281687 RepID=A0A8R1DGD4_CAEJA
MSATTYFPGVPMNTDPVTTMATSSSDTMTTPSTASAYPTTAPSGSGALPGASPAKPSLEEATRAVSSLEKGEKDKAPGSVDPTATATTSTATSNAGGTSTTAKGGTTATTTTTTTSSGTTATGRMSPQVPLQTLFNEAIARCNNCLFLIRKLRSKQSDIIDLFLYTEVDQENFHVALQEYRDFGTIVKEVMNLYEKLEHYSRRLPKVVPPIDNINVMRTLYTQEHTMAHTNINYLIEKMIDSGNWNEGNYQGFYYLSELLRVHGHRKRQMTEDHRRKVLPACELKATATTGHIAFEAAYMAMKKDIVNQSLGIYPRIMHQTATSLVIEFLFGCGGTKTSTDQDVVFTMKFLLVERNGHVEYINMMAPHEEWLLYNNFGPLSVNPFSPSRFDVYRRLTKQANIHLYTCFGSHASRWTANTLIQFVSLFGKFRQVFQTKCRACKQITKNFLPPLIFDIRNPSIAYHEGCR